MKKTTKSESPNAHLDTVPLREWPPSAMLSECARAAGLWSSEPAFLCGGPLDDAEARAQEIALRVLGYLKKKPANDAISQITFFYKIAGYCKPGIIQSSYYIKTVPSDSGGDDEVGTDEMEYPNQAIGEVETVDGLDGEDGDEKLKKLLRKIGVTELDHSMFDCTAKEWKAATGFSERDFRTTKARRKEYIAAEIDRLCSGPGAPIKIRKKNEQSAAVRMFYYTKQVGLIGVDDGKFLPKPAALRFHWVGAEQGLDEYEVREFEPGGNWAYKCRVHVDSAQGMDAQKVLDAFMGTSNYRSSDLNLP